MSPRPEIEEAVRRLRAVLPDSPRARALAIAGAVAIAGGGYLATRPDDPPAPPPAEAVRTEAPIDPAPSPPPPAAWTGPRRSAGELDARIEACTAGRIDCPELGELLREAGRSQ